MIWSTARQLRTNSVLTILPARIDDIVIENEWAQIENTERFLLSHQKEGDEQIIIFSSNTWLRAPAESTRWHADRMFRATVSDFQQVYIVHALHEGHMIPCIYALLTNKTEKRTKNLYTNWKKLLCLFDVFWIQRCWWRILSKLQWMSQASFYSCQTGRLLFPYGAKILSSRCCCWLSNNVFERRWFSATGQGVYFTCARSTGSSWARISFYNTNLEFPLESVQTQMNASSNYEKLCWWLWHWKTSTISDFTLERI